jgi:hypothetical protein
MAYCNACGMRVLLFEDKVFKACLCEAPIIADVSAVTKGVGGAQA